MGGGLLRCFLTQGDASPSPLTGQPRGLPCASEGLFGPEKVVAVVSDDALDFLRRRQLSLSNPNLRIHTRLGELISHYRERQGANRDTETLSRSGLRGTVCTVQYHGTAEKILVQLDPARRS